MKLSGLLPYFINAYKADLNSTESFEKDLIRLFNTSNWGQDRPYEYRKTIKTYMEVLPTEVKEDPDFAKRCQFLNFFREDNNIETLHREYASLNGNKNISIQYNVKHASKFEDMVDYALGQHNGDLIIVALLGVISSDIGYTSTRVPSSLSSKLVEYIDNKWPVTSLFTPSQMQIMLSSSTNSLVNAVHAQTRELLNPICQAVEAFFSGSNYHKTNAHITSSVIATILANKVIDYAVDNNLQITCNPEQVSYQTNNSFYSSGHKLWKAVSVVPNINKLKRAYDQVSINTSNGAIRVGLEAKFLLPKTKEELVDVMSSYKDKGKIQHHNYLNLPLNPTGYIATGKLEEVISVYRSRYWVEYVFFVRGIAGTLTDDEIYWALTHTTNSNIQQGAMLFMRTMNTYHLTDLGITEFKDLTVQTVQLSKSSGDINLRDVMDTQYPQSYAMYGVFASGE